MAPPSHSSEARRVVVVGGGLAGMAAAVALQSAGVVVTLIEARRNLGGRAGSFVDPQSGEILDNCQHVLLGCCTNLVDFYRRIGAEKKIRWENQIHFMNARGECFSLSAVSALPAPLHLGPAMAGFGLLTIPERLAVSRAMLVMLRLGRSGREKLADVPFGQWLDRYRQPEAAMVNLYDPIVVSGLNERTSDASAAYAIKIFQEALLFNRGGYALGLPACPLGELYESIPDTDMRLGVRAAGLRFDGDCVRGVLIGDGEMQADAVVLATNHHSIDKWVPENLLARDERFAHLEKLESVPILGAHLWFDRPVMKRSHAALVSGPLQWLFRKDETGKAVHGVISAAREWVGVAREECLAQFECQIRQTLPAAREAKLERGVIVVEKRATFSPRPGVDRWRPAQGAAEGGIGNLFLAGDYTRTGWPATMEGAVRGGYLAADAVLRFFGIQRASFLAADLATEWVARQFR